MIKQYTDLERRAEEIIKLSQAIVYDKACVDPNNYVLVVVLYEFREILNILRNNRLLLLTSKRQPIGSLFTISDSASPNFNKQLLNKIEEFEKLCLLVDEQDKIYRYIDGQELFHRYKDT